MIFHVVVLSVLLASSTAQVTQSSYSEHHEEDLHANQIPPPQYQPSQEEVKKAIVELVKEKIDKNKDTKLTTEELTNWLEIVHHSIIEDSVERQWKYYSPTVQEVHSWEGYSPEMREVIGWELFKDMTYPEEYLNDGSPQAEQMKKLLIRSEKRWRLADKNSDTVLTIEEFKDFVHPEESKTMQGILVDEAVEDMDANNYGKILIQEYLDHLFSVTDETEREDPNWKPVRHSRSPLLIILMKCLFLH